MSESNRQGGQIQRKQRGRIMSNSPLHSLRRENAEHYVTIKALKHHYNLNWGDIKRIVKKFKEENPKPEVIESVGRGITQAKEGKLNEHESFAKHANDEID